MDRQYVTRANIYNISMVLTRTGDTFSYFWQCEPQKPHFSGSRNEVKANLYQMVVHYTKLAKKTTVKEIKAELEMFKEMYAAIDRIT